jgi:hypothetical protein
MTLTYSKRLVRLLLLDQSVAQSQVEVEMSNILQSMRFAEIAIRMATPADEHSLLRLAELDSAHPIAGDALIASADGIPVAAYSLTERRTIADPFRPTAAIVELLEARAENLRGMGRQASAQSGWRTTGFRAAPASSSRRTGVV